MDSRVEALTDAIKQHRVVRLGYSRQSDGVLSLHNVAPLDLRPGESARTANTVYLWAYCFEESRVETHILDRVRSVHRTADLFDPAEILARWPRHKWPLPAEWVVPRDW